MTTTHTTNHFADLAEILLNQYLESIKQQHQADETKLRAVIISHLAADIERKSLF